MRQVADGVNDHAHDRFGAFVQGFQDDGEAADPFN